MTDAHSDGGRPSNRVLSLADVPAIDPEDFEPLDARLLRARNVIALSVGLVVAIVELVVIALLDVPSVIGVGAILLVLGLTAIAVVATRVSFRHWGYLVREQDLTVCHGVLNRTVTSVSFNRVQHASVNSGPLERWLGLATLRVFTAGGVGADVTIEGLRQADAAALQRLVLANVALAGQSTAVIEA
ncbi:MAG: PH domain-containing protein [Acidimicrobiales bacterium]